MTRPTFVYATFINTTPEKLWEALTNGEFTERYWGRRRVRSDWRVGSRIEFRVDEDGTLEHSGEVLECEPPRRLVMTFRVESDPEARDHPPSRVTYELEPFGSAVKLTVTHDELDHYGTVPEELSTGWTAILSSLKTFLETGQPLAMTTVRWKPPRDRSAR